MKPGYLFLSLIAFSGCQTRSNNDSSPEAARIDESRFSGPSTKADEQNGSAEGRGISYTKTFNASNGDAVKIVWKFYENKNNDEHDVQVNLGTVSISDSNDDYPNEIEFTNICLHTSGSIKEIKKEKFWFTVYMTVPGSNLKPMHQQGVPTDDKFYIYRNHLGVKQECIQEFTVKSKKGEMLHDKISGKPVFTLKL